MSSASQQIIFFLRHYNDIDHIVPVIDSWCDTYSIPVSVILLSRRRYLDDFRIEYLAERDSVTVKHVNDILGEDTPNEVALRSLVITGLKSAGRRLPTTVPRRVWNTITGDTDGSNRSLPEGQLVLDALTHAADDAVVVFDWPTSPEKPVGQFTQEVLAAAQTEGYSTVSLPHGDKPYINHLRQNPQFDAFLDSDSIATGTDPVERNPPFGVQNFDSVVHPNDRSAERVEPYVDSGQLQVLGSPRYNDEWIPRLSTLVPSPSLPTDREHAFVLFLRNANYPIFWAEVVRAIRLVSEFAEFELIVKHHTRSSRLEKFFQEKHGFDISEYENVQFVGDEIHSVPLIQWADVVLDLGTSIAFEPVVRQMQVLSLEFAHANESTISHYIEGSRLPHRDALYEALRTIRAGKDVYDPTGQEQFRSEMLGADTDVLTNYVAFLAEQFTKVPIQDEITN